jgi:hypothetical protein
MVKRSKSIRKWCIGEDQTYTAMAKTVAGCNGDFANIKRKDNHPGVQLPIRKEVYLPILKELKNKGSF